MEKSKIYTRTGDRGQTSLVGGKRVSKYDVRLEAYGTVDELNSYLGMLIATLPVSSSDTELLQFIQNKLFVVGSYLATDTAFTELREASRMKATDVERIERREVAGQYEVDELILRFINRLSDYLFVLSRFMNVEEGIEEIYWNNSCE